MADSHENTPGTGDTQSRASVSDETLAKGPATCKCGAAWRPEVDRHGVWRCWAAHPRPGMTIAWRHGGRSLLARQSLLPEQTARLEAVERKRLELTKELGKIGVLKRDLVSRYLESDTIAAMLGESLVAKGVTTNKGRTRCTVAAYFAAAAHQVRLAELLGLAHGKQKGARSSLAEHQARIEGARGQEPGASEA